MPLKIIREDIVNMTCDAIVNPTDPEYSHRGGVDLQIHAAAGEAPCRPTEGRGHSRLLPARSLLSTLHHPR